MATIQFSWFVCVEKVAKMSEEAGKALGGCTVLIAGRCIQDHGSIIGQSVLIGKTKSIKWQKPA